MDLGLADRVALVTGAGGGMGAAVALRLADEGCDVALVDLPGTSTRALAAAIEQRGRRALAIDADVSDCARAEAAVAETVAQLGGLDIVVCAAGITRDGVSWKLSEADWDAVLSVNLKGYFNYARAAIPALRARGGGRIVAIGSINGLRGKFGQGSYAAAKAGMVGLSKSLAREVGRFGITVNVVAPGMTDSPMTRALGESVREAAVAEAVLGRICCPDDIADAVLFLGSQRARQITGEVLRVDAGQYI